MLIPFTNHNDCGSKHSINKQPLTLHKAKKEEHKSNEWSAISSGFDFVIGYRLVSWQLHKKYIPFYVLEIVHVIEMTL